MEEPKARAVERGNIKYIAFFVLAIIAGAVIYLMQVKDSVFTPPQMPRLVVGLPAPNIILPGLDGKAVDLASYRGKVVFLNIWATWCPTCREEMPSMERLYKEFKGKDFEILAVSIDAPGAKVVVPFMKDFGLSFPALLDPQVTVKNLYGITGVPESFIIDKTGIVQKVVIGPIDWATPEMATFFRDLMQKPR
jgi:peroxiredoxin